MALWPKKKASSKESKCDPHANPFAVFKNVGLKVGQQDILQGVSLAFSEQRIGIIGLNGSGKSSLVRMLNGLRQPTTGTLDLFGTEQAAVLSELPRHIGFVFQNPDHQAIFPTVEEEIAFGLAQLGEDKTASREKARIFLENHGCGFLAQKPIAELSEGQKQLICILAVLVMNPSVLVLDEPMTSLDALASRMIFDKLMSLPQRVIMVSHDLEYFASFDRVIWLEKGTVRMDGAPDSVIAAYQSDIARRSGDQLQAANL